MSQLHTTLFFLLLFFNLLFFISGGWGWGMKCIQTIKVTKYILSHVSLHTDFVKCWQWRYFLLMSHSAMHNRTTWDLAVALHLKLKFNWSLSAHMLYNKFHMFFLGSTYCYIKWINYLFIVRDWDTVSISCFSNIGQSYLPPVCCVVSFLLSLNATYFKHASTSCSTTKTKPKK